MEGRGLDPKVILRLMPGSETICHSVEAARARALAADEAAAYVADIQESEGCAAGEAAARHSRLASPADVARGLLEFVEERPRGVGVTGLGALQATPVRKRRKRRN
jgi:hypothetical protein